MELYYESSQTIKTDRKTYLYLKEEEAETHCKEMLDSGWVDEVWNSVSVHDLDDQGIEYITIGYIKTTSL